MFPSQNIWVWIHWNEKKMPSFEDVLWKMSWVCTQVIYSFFLKILSMHALPCRMHSRESKFTNTVWHRICQKGERTSAGWLQIKPGPQRLLCPSQDKNPFVQHFSGTFPYSTFLPQMDQIILFQLMVGSIRV